MSRYLVNKFLYTVDRDPDLVARYKADPVGTVLWWEAERANQLLNCVSAEKSTWLGFAEAEREALSRQDHVALFKLGAHPFLTLTLFIAMFEPDHEPLAYVRSYAQQLNHLTLPYPDIAT